MANKQFKLAYQDSDDEWMSISDDEDTQAFNEFATGQKTKLFFKITGKDASEDAKQDSEIEEKVKFEDLKDFEINDVLEKIEAMFNSEEKFGPMKLFRVGMESDEGTKAEQHPKRLARVIRKRGGGRKRSHSGKGKYDWRQHLKENRESVVIKKSTLTSQLSIQVALVMVDHTEAHMADQCPTEVQEDTVVQSTVAQKVPTTEVVLTEAAHAERTKIQEFPTSHKTSR